MSFLKSPSPNNDRFEYYPTWFNGDLCGFHGDLVGFNGDLWGFIGDIMGFTRPGYDIHSSPWKDPAISKNGMAHLFRYMGHRYLPWRTVTVITRLGNLWQPGFST